MIFYLILNKLMEKNVYTILMCIIIYAILFLNNSHKYKNEILLGLLLIDCALLFYKNNNNNNIIMDKNNEHIIEQIMDKKNDQIINIDTDFDINIEPQTDNSDVYEKNNEPQTDNFDIEKILNKCNRNIEHDENRYNHSNNLKMMKERHKLMEPKLIFR